MISVLNPPAVRLFAAVISLQQLTESINNFIVKGTQNPIVRILFSNFKALFYILYSLLQGLNDIVCSTTHWHVSPTAPLNDIVYSTAHWHVGLVLQRISIAEWQGVHYRYWQIAWQHWSPYCSNLVMKYNQNYCTGPNLSKLEYYCLIKLLPLCTSIPKYKALKQILKLLPLHLHPKI